LGVVLVDRGTILLPSSSGVGRPLTGHVTLLASFAFSSYLPQEGTMTMEDRLDPRELADIERLAKEGLQGGLLEQAWCRRALALVREVRMLRERLAAVEDQDS